MNHSGRNNDGFNEFMDTLRSLFEEKSERYWDRMHRMIESTEDVVTTKRVTNVSSFGCTPGCTLNDGIIVQTIDAAIVADSINPEDLHPSQQKVTPKALAERSRSVWIFACSEHMNDVTMVPLHPDSARELVNALQVAIADLDNRFPQE